MKPFPTVPGNGNTKIPGSLYANTRHGTVINASRPGPGPNSIRNGAIHSGSLVSGPNKATRSRAGSGRFPPATTPPQPSTSNPGSISAPIAVVSGGTMGSLKSRVGHTSKNGNGLSSCVPRSWPRSNSMWETS